MIFFALSGLINGIGALLFGIISYRKNPQSRLYKVFAALNLSVAFWSLAYFFWLTRTDYDSALAWVRVLSLGANFIPVFYFHWIVILLGGDKKYALLLKGAYAFAAVLSFSIFSGLFIEDLAVIGGFKFWPVAGPFYSVYILYYLVLSGLGLCLLISRYRNSRGFIRSQMQYVFLGTFIGFGCGFTNFPMWYGLSVKPFLNIGVVLYMAILTYAMVKHRLMDIRFVLRRWSVNFISWLTIVLLIIVIRFSYSRLITTAFYGSDYLFIIFGIIIYPPLTSYYYRIANKYFFTSLYDAQTVIAELSEKLSSTLELNKIYKHISDSLSKSLHTQSVHVYIFNEKTRQYEPGYYYGSEIISQRAFVEDRGFYSNYLFRNAPVVIEDLKRQNYVRYRRTIDHLLSQKAEIIIPLRLKDRTIGLIALGAKESHDIYNNDDIKLLEVIGAQSAIAIENAINYEEVRTFSQKLQKEVERATKDLVRANDKLKQLDQAKSEFVSIASHQLRTPLTIIKGYISMFLEGSFGRLEGIQKDSMEKVYLSNERLIQLVENLLNISRIESGRLIINKEPVDLAQMIENIIEDLKGPAKKKGLKLEFSRAKKDKLVASLDQEKIRQAVLNLLDNAVKYTKKGKIKIGLKSSGKELIFSVEDKGMGIKPGDLSGLFTKFSRGSGIALVNTEGTGLGLYVAKQMVESHGGRIWAESKGEGKGAKFTFTLPLAG